MKRLLIIVLATVLFLTLVGGGVSYSLALNAPYAPGDALFGVQTSSEQLWALSFNNDATNRTEILLQLLSRRLDELEIVTGTPHEAVGLTAVDDTFMQVLTALAEVPASQQPALITALANLAERGQQLLAAMEPGEGTALLWRTLDHRFGRFLTIAGTPAPDIAALLAEVTDAGTFLAEIELTPSPQAVAAFPDALADPRAIPFPPNADMTAAHNFFPLTDGHADLECLVCHNGPTYQGTETRCVACHLDDDTHEGAFGADCATCHTATKWEDATFDHATIGTQDCVECHNPPENHYAGACRECHQDTTDFKNAFFDHTLIGSQDCVACHAPPANHYEGACRDCHQDTTDFKNAFFDHSRIGSQDCVVCHAPPANHFEGVCRDCHQDTANFKNAFFDHSRIGSQDCVVCHAAPANHYTGSCRSCHTDTANFRNVTFNHAGLVNCSGCHTPPANHFPGQCSQCHNTTTFSGATFSHTFPMNHGDANGDCAKCHNDGGTGAANCFLCHNQQEVEREHREEGISDFANCMACHANGDEGDDHGDSHEDGGGDDGGDEGDDHDDDDGDDEEDDD